MSYEMSDSAAGAEGGHSRRRREGRLGARRTLTRAIAAEVLSASGMKYDIAIWANIWRVALCTAAIVASTSWQPAAVSAAEL